MCMLFTVSSIHTVNIEKFELCKSVTNDTTTYLSPYNNVFYSETETFIVEETTTKQETKPETTWIYNDYLNETIENISNGEITQGRRNCELYNKQNEILGKSFRIDFDELYLLAKIVEAEAGSEWLTDEHKRLVASVVLNRVEHWYYPDNIFDVVHQKGQYAAVGSNYFDNLIPSKNSVVNALFVLENGSICDENIVYQAEFKQGSGVYKTFYDEIRKTTTYFCYF